MDHLTFAQLLGNYGEFIGAIGVVVTLAYLAIQIRQNTKTLRSSIYTSWVETASTTHTMIAANPSIYAELVNPSVDELSDLTVEGQIALETWCTHTFNVFEASFLHHMEGAIDDGIFDAKHRNMVVFFQRPFVIEIWQQLAEHVYDQRFIEYIKRNVLQHG